MQAECHLCWSTWGVRLTAGALAACDVLQLLCDAIGATLEPYAFPPPRQSRGWCADTAAVVATYIRFGLDCCVLAVLAGFFLGLAAAWGAIRTIWLSRRAQDH
eukprot:4841021-Alexandrium_andersonii.AAC.1